MNLSTLFGKLQHKIEVKRLFENEECDEKNKRLALKATDVKDMKLEDKESQSKSNEDMHLIFQIFKEFIMHKNIFQMAKNKVKKDQPSSQHTFSTEINVK